MDRIAIIPTHHGDIVCRGLCLSLTFFCAAATARAEVTASFAGRLEIDAPVALALEAKGALAPWRMMFSGGMTERDDGTRDFAFTSDGAPRISGTFRVGNGADGGASRPGEPTGADPRAARKGGSEAEPPSVVAEWTFTPAADMHMEMFGLMGDLHMEDYGNGTLLVDGELVPLPKVNNPEDVRRQKVSLLSIMDADGGRRLDFAFREPVNLFVQYWGGKTMSLRFILPPDNPVTLLYRGGRARTLAFALSGAGPHRKSTLKPTTVEAGPDWIPFDASGGIAEGSALDFSEMRPTGKPCGLFGRVVAHGPHFEFKGLPGVPQRFYGVNLCMTANYPESLESARSLARTLARVGYNSVRIHHHDGICTDKGDPAATCLDEKTMRQMDALVTACAEEGLYISTDLFVSRTNASIPWRAVGVDRNGSLSMQDFKRTVYVHEGVYSNFLAFTAEWLNHVNAYTGLRYAEEPALAWISLVNEANIDDMSGHDFASHPGWQEAWDKWLAVRKAADPETWAGVTPELPNGLGKNRQGRAFLVFLQDVETRFVERTRRFLADLGCHALITDMNNCGQFTAAMEKVRAEALDYVDTHFYVDHPRFLEKDWSLPSWCPNDNPFKGAAMGAAAISAVRILDRPFAVSEYNFCGPGRYRGVGGIATGAEAALQNWAGLWRFAWAHKIGDATAPGTQPLGHFNIANDPLLLASERASVCLFLRGDAAPLDTTYVVTMPRRKLGNPDAAIATSARTDWVWAAWDAKIGTIPGDSAPEGTVWAGDFDTAFMKSSEGVRRDLGIDGGAPDDRALQKCSDGAVRIDREHGTFLLDTPRTAGGFAEAGEFEAGSLSAHLDGAPATIWASSLDGKPLSESRRILVTHLTDVQNTGAFYADADMTILKNFGRLPYLMRNGRAEVSLALSGGSAAESPSFAVHALAPDGARRAEVPCSYDPVTGHLDFIADVARDPSNATYFYEIERKDEIAPVTKNTLYFAGASTLDEHGGDESRWASWGSSLRPFLREGCAIVNYGRSGRSTTSFIREGWWGKIVDALVPGDFVVIQFGHNDQKLDKPDVATPIPQFRENLRRMAAEVRAKGATPVFATPIVRLTYGKDGLLTDAPRLDDWAEAMRETAAEIGVDLVDMRAMTRKAANEAGEAEALTWYAPGDRTHPAVKGARLYAHFFLDDVRRRGLPIAGLFVPETNDTNPK